MNPAELRILAMKAGDEATNIRGGAGDSADHQADLLDELYRGLNAAADDVESLDRDYGAMGEERDSWRSAYHALLDVSRVVIDAAARKAPALLDYAQRTLDAFAASADNVPLGIEIGWLMTWALNDPRLRATPAPDSIEAVTGGGTTNLGPTWKPAGACGALRDLFEKHLARVEEERAAYARFANEASAKRRRR